MSETPKLELPEVAEGQASKHITYNEGIRWLDVLVQLVVKDRTNTPPGSPSEGDTYIVTSGPTGAWSGFAEHDIAAYINGAWANKTPDEGWWAYVQDENIFYFFNSASAWASAGVP